MTEYVVTALVWSTIGLIIGYLLGTGKQVSFAYYRLGKAQRDRVAALCLILIALLTTAQSLYFQRTQADITKCQTKYNQLFQETLRTRAEISDRDRQNTVQMATGVINAKSREAARKAVLDYIAVNQKLSVERSQNQFPVLSQDVCVHKTGE